MGDDTWRLFSELCQKVVENENCYLEVYVYPNGLTFMGLYPCEDDDWEDEDE